MNKSANPQMANRGRRARRAFTIIEVIVIVVILGVIAALIAPRLFSRVGQSKQAVANANAASLAGAMRMFLADHGKPEAGASISILWERPATIAEDKWQPYVENADALKDPWDRPFLLVTPGPKNVDFDITSYGPHGQPGGTAANADIIKP